MKALSFTGRGGLNKQTIYPRLQKKKENHTASAMTTSYQYGEPIGIEKYGAHECVVLLVFA